MPTPGEAQLVSEAKGYDGGVAAEAKRQVDSYFENFRDRDTPANWGIVLRMSDPAIQDEMSRLYGEAHGMRVEPDVIGQIPDAARGTSADAGNATVGRAVPVERGLLEGTGADPTVQEKLGVISDPGSVALGARAGSLRATDQAAQSNVAARQGTAPIPDAMPPMLNASAQQPPQGPGFAAVGADVAPLRMSQSANQGVVEPEEAKRLRGDAYGLEQQAIEDSTFAEKFAGTQRLELENERIGKLNQMAKEDAEFQARQRRIAAESETRIAQAEQALKDAEVDPNFNPMREIMEGDDWGKKIQLGLGMLLGSVGASAQTNATGIYHANQFLEQFNLSVNRKIDLMEKRYRSRKDQLGAAQDGYARMRQILQDDQATRAMIEARAWQMFDAEMDKVMQQYGIDMAEPKAQMLRAEAATRAREKVMESARTTNHVVGTQEAFRPTQIVPLGGDDKTGKNIEAIVKARQTKELPLIEGALDNMATALQSMAKDESSRDQLAVILRTGNGLGKGMARYLVNDSAGYARLGAALGDYARIKSGTAQTKIELENLAGLVGTGDLEALRQFYGILQNERRTKESDIKTMEGYDAFSQRKAGQVNDKAYEPRVDPIGAPAVK